MSRILRFAQPHADKLRFIAGGISTTLAFYLFYLLLLLLLPAKPSFVIAYALSIVWSYTVNSIWVFRKAWTWQGLLAFPVVYAVQGVASYLLFVVLIDRLGIHHLLAPLLVTVLLLPLTFLLSRTIVHRTSGTKPLT